MAVKKRKRTYTRKPKVEKPNSETMQNEEQTTQIETAAGYEPVWKPNGKEEAEQLIASCKPIKPCRAIYHAPDGDMPVVVIGVYADAPDGERYLRIEGTDTAIPASHTERDLAPKVEADILEQLPAKYAVAEKSTDEWAKEAAPEAFVIQDEWHGQLETGRPFDDCARPFQASNPDKEFRFLSNRDSVIKSRGRRGYQDVKGADGKTVGVAGMSLGWIPKDEADRRRKSKLDAATNMLETKEAQFKEDASKVLRDNQLGNLVAGNDDATFEGQRQIS